MNFYFKIYIFIVGLICVFVGMDIYCRDISIKENDVSRNKLEYEIKEYKLSENEDLFKKFKTACLYFTTEKEDFEKVSSTRIPFTDEYLNNWMRRSEKEDMHCYVAENTMGEIVGFITTKESSASGFELMFIIVGKQFQGNGIGKALIKFCKERAKEVGFSAVDVDVYAYNKVMLRLVIGFDFVPVSFKYHVGSRGEDLLRLQCYLKQP